MSGAERIRIHQLVRGCTNCSLHSVGSGPIPLRGPTPASIAVIGEAPGASEDREGKPFVGPSGMAAQNWLSEVGIDPESIAWLNVVSCYPNRAPNPREVELCSDTLEIQLRLIQPDWILLFGGVAVSHWWRVRVGDLRGLWWELREDWARKDGCGAAGPMVMATWHPAAVLRNPRLEWQAKSDVKRFAEAALTGRLWFLRELYCVICHREKVLRYDEKGLGWCFKHDPQAQRNYRGAKFPSRKVTGKQQMGML